MGSLSLAAQAGVATMTGDMLRLLQLDDLWTGAVAQTLIPSERTPALAEVESLAGEMIDRLGQMQEHVDLLRKVGEDLGDDGEDRLNSLLWGTELNSEDRTDLRWLLTRAGGFQSMARSAGDVLSSYDSEVNLLEQQLTFLRQGEAATGDLSRRYRCGLGQGLIIGGAASLPATAVAAAGAGVTVGAIGAAVLVAATGGVAGVAVLIAGLFVIRKARC